MKRNIPNFTRYQIDEYGNISRNDNKIMKSRLLDGYLQIRLISDTEHKKKHLYIHRLVALTFLEQNGLNKNFINHKDGNKLNNHVSNLEWCTRSENNIHAYKIGLIIAKKGEDHKDAVLTEINVLQARLWYNSGNWTIRKLASHFKVANTTMYNVITKKTWTHIN